MNEISRVLLPKNMKPRIEAFEELGFVFLDYNDELVYVQQMPDCWSILTLNGQIVIIDYLKRTRAICENNELVLLPMYQVYAVSNMDNTSYEVFFGNDTQKIKSFGKVNVSKNATQEEIMAMRIVLDKLIKNAVYFANLYYPMWQDALAYWDNNEYFQIKKTGR